MWTNIEVHNRDHHIATANHMPYGITQYYLPPGRGDFPTFTPVEAGIQFSGPEGKDAKLSYSDGQIQIMIESLVMIWFEYKRFDLETCDLI